MEKIQAVVAAAISPALVVPDDIVDFIGKPSLLETEIAADYDALLHRLAETVKPKDAVEWLWVADVTNLVWEMRRLRGMRDGIVERETGQGLGDLVEDILSADHEWYDLEIKKDRLIAHWNSGNAFRRKIVLKFLKTRGVDLRQIHAVVYRRRMDEFTKLEGLIANLGHRRDSVLREIERRRDTVARRLRDVTDAEFEITKSGIQSVGN